ncbi:peptidylprolyl isomerase [Streptomyces sp. N2-109]|uniref:Peptidylprolyl isomerase n=1 Tax=Streptomyces gossypii TaxID=2883101 RepID=A0ABT2JL26_9ACTN|nr:peptidylprolyl isomerase [Streptomyces gossypii]MCT2588572.1 peptidylprolyl isomerase [Streptomyces gossypii]
MVSSEQRRKQLAREKFLRQQERRAQSRRKSRIRASFIATGLVLVLAAGAAYAASGGLGGDEDKAEDKAADAQPTPSKAPDPCEKPAKGKPNGKQWKKEPKLTVDKSAAYEMTLATTCGDIPIELDADKAPHTVNSFAFLADKGFFDHTACHRLTTSGGLGVLQCGDPTGQGDGGPGYTIPDENLDDPRIKGQTYPAGTIAMANTGQKDSGGSQFFLVHKDSQLPPQYTPFGTVSEAGMKVLKKIADAGEASGQGDGPPNATVVIDKATVKKA